MVLQSQLYTVLTFNLKKLVENDQGSNALFSLKLDLNAGI